MATNTSTPPGLNQDECDGLRDMFERSNRIAITQAFFGSLGVVLCTLCVFIIFATGSDKILLRERVLTALFISNWLYSWSDVIPVNMYVLSGPNCGDFVIGNPDEPGNAAIVGTCSPLTLFFFSLYMTTGLELFMIYASIKGLKSAKEKPLSVKEEVVAYTLCIAFGIFGAIYYFFECKEHMYEAREQQQDMMDDYLVNEVYDTGMQKHQIPVFGIIAISVVAWSYQRILYHQFLKESKEIKEQEQDLLDALSADGHHQNKHKVLDARENICHEIVKPLEPYIVIIIVFVIPMIVLQLDWCLKESLYLQEGGGANNELYPCNFFCEMVLSMRSPALATVYLTNWLWNSTQKDRSCNLLCGKCGRRVCYKKKDSYRRVKFLSSSLSSHSSDKHDWHSLDDRFNNEKRLAKGTMIVLEDIDMMAEAEMEDADVVDQFKTGYRLMEQD